MKQIIIIALLAVGVTVSAQTETLSHAHTDCEVIEIPYPDDRNICIWPLPGYHEIPYKSTLVSTDGFGEGPYSIAVKLLDPELKMKRKSKFKPIDWSMLDNNMIDSRKEFRSFRDQIDLDVDWRSQKITFYTNSRTFKFGMLESDYTLMGVTISEDGKILYLGYRSSFHGVCQGIAQQSEWFSYSSDIYAIVIPNTVEEIRSTSCYFGPDCSEIP